MLREDIRKRRTKIWKKIIIVSSSLFWGEEYVWSQYSYIVWKGCIYIYNYIYIYTLIKSESVIFLGEKEKLLIPQKD